MNLTSIEQKLGKTLQDHQREAVEYAANERRLGNRLRMCLYHRTGAGKTITSLASMVAVGAADVMVIAPPVTHDEWVRWGSKLDLTITPYSHAKFRQPSFKVSRGQPIIVDEFHLLGGHVGKGWKKLDRIARGLLAPLVIASATPNYNDAERVYCIQHVLSPLSIRGGYLQFIYNECETRHNPFGNTPEVIGFHGGRSAEEYLKSLPGVHYVEDVAIKQVNIIDFDLPALNIPQEFDTYGMNPRSGRICASLMETRHARNKLAKIDDVGLARLFFYGKVIELAHAGAKPAVVFSASATIATALQRSLEQHSSLSSLLVTGRDTTPAKIAKVELFKNGGVDLLIGTATLATGVDGIDKMCDHLIIVDDTDDDSLRRQLIGRILPRGLDDDVSGKVVYRLNVS